MIGGYPGARPLLEHTSLPRMAAYRREAIPLVSGSSSSSRLIQFLTQLRFRAYLSCLFMKGSVEHRGLTLCWARLVHGPRSCGAPCAVAMGGFLPWRQYGLGRLSLYQCTAGTHAHAHCKPGCHSNGQWWQGRHLARAHCLQAHPRAVHSRHGRQ